MLAGSNRGVGDRRAGGEFYGRQSLTGGRTLDTPVEGFRMAVCRLRASEENLNQCLATKTAPR